MSRDFQLREDTDNYAVMGNPVAHSQSPRIHHAFALQTGEKLYYQAILVPVGRFARVLDDFQGEGGKGFNVTVPFKQDACMAMDVLTARAEQAGAVNTVWFDDAGRRHGDTTDGAGLIRDLDRNGVDPAGKSVLMLGAGGAVRGVLGEILQRRPARVLIANRTQSRAQDLIRSFPTPVETRAAGFEELASKGAFELVVNATPAGLTAELPELPPGLLAEGGCCYDMVYGTGQTTPFVSWGRQQGAAICLDGLGMLVEQAAESFYIWRGVHPETQPVIDMLRGQ